MRWLIALMMVAAMVVGTTSRQAFAAGLDMSSPSDGAALCGNSVTIQGAMNWGVAGGYISDTYEYRAQGTTTWSTIVSYTVAPGAGAAYLGTLTTWNTTGLAAGTYYIRATVVATNGAATDFTSVYIDHAPPVVTWTEPAANAVVRGVIALRGSATDGGGTSQVTIEWKPAASTVYGLIIRYDTLSGAFNWTWNTQPHADGDYTLRVTAVDGCGQSTVITRTVTLDNTPPVVTFNNVFPLQCGTGRTAQLYGSVSDIHLATWGSDLHNVPIYGGATNVSNYLLCSVGFPTGVQMCNDWIRVRATDSAQDMNGQPNVTEWIVPLDMRCPGDFNRDGFISVQDIFDFLGVWFSPCP